MSSGSALVSLLAEVIQQDEWTDGDAVFISDPPSPPRRPPATPRVAQEPDAHLVCCQLIRHLATCLGNSSPVRGGAHVHDDAHPQATHHEQDPQAAPHDARHTGR
ncbi:hypothetical protein FA95DRAFT_1613733 [Auriscalpium vulgare]|uniref:Uncharacterized protein n=1 Tax=Auriscalpium vulgare TaxID=40419 RepID=A0ACB8R230_9AGAM|nr:hypothetical protein FA95DRAFT_1613733 [Auriscalpium vulgare]